MFSIPSTTDLYEIGKTIILTRQLIWDHSKTIWFIRRYVFWDFFTYSHNHHNIERTKIFRTSSWPNFWYEQIKPFRFSKFWWFSNISKHDVRHYSYLPKMLFKREILKMKGKKKTHKWLHIFRFAIKWVRNLPRGHNTDVQYQKHSNHHKQLNIFYNLKVENIREWKKGKRL